ncbi:MAG TPA: DUF2721 domain-containing protein [Steroidobacteraceae bacterium]|nr:DUF2721 domain-containing protein [Steroidobacteraceae bacterium]
MATAYTDAMEPFTHIASIGQAIQLAVAPVFLLTGVGAALNVLASRLGRIIDRARIMEDQLTRAAPHIAADMHTRLNMLSKRAKLINRAIVLSVLSGILVSLVVASLFVSAVLKIDLSLPVAIAFVSALLSLAFALIYFLREVFVATESLRFGPK